MVSAMRDPSAGRSFEGVQGMTPQIDRAAVAGVELDYELGGAGEPVVLVHAGVCADFFRPLLEQEALTASHMVVSYHRAGYAGSTRVPGALSLADQARHCAALMRRLEIERAHVVGHSSGVSIALQLALDAPELVASLVLMDPARPTAKSALQEQQLTQVVGPALELYRRGDRAAAIASWMEGVCGPDWAGPLERALPGAVKQAVADADTFFGQEIPAIVEWSFGPEEAARITQPVLAVLGENSRPIFRERRDLLMGWLRDVESYVLPGATHLLQVENPGPLATALTGFLARHAFDS